MTDSVPPREDQVRAVGQNPFGHQPVGVGDVSREAEAVGAARVEDRQQRGQHFTPAVLERHRFAQAVKSGVYRGGGLWTGEPAEDPALESDLGLVHGPQDFFAAGFGHDLVQRLADVAHRACFVGGGAPPFSLAAPDRNFRCGAPPRPTLRPVSKALRAGPGDG